jgi:nuclear pore complex protein Nup54
MRARLENIQDELNQSEQFHGKLSQLWAQLQLIKESGRKYGNNKSNNNNNNNNSWNEMNDNDMQVITQVLYYYDMCLYIYICIF